MVSLPAPPSIKPDCTADSLSLDEDRVVSSSTLDGRSRNGVKTSELEEDGVVTGTSFKQVGTVIGWTGDNDAVVTAAAVNGSWRIGIKRERMVSSPSSEPPESALWL